MSFTKANGYETFLVNKEIPSIITKKDVQYIAKQSVVLLLLKISLQKHENLSTDLYRTEWTDSKKIHLMYRIRKRNLPYKKWTSIHYFYLFTSKVEWY